MCVICENEYDSWTADNDMEVKPKYKSTWRKLSTVQHYMKNL